MSTRTARQRSQSLQESGEPAVNGKATPDQPAEGQQSPRESSPSSDHTTFDRSMADDDRSRPTHTAHASGSSNMSNGTPARQVADTQHAKDVRAAFAGVPKLRPQWTHKYMTILVVGESGLGKTTFIQNMFAAYCQDSTLPVNDASAPTAKEDFISAPEKLCTDITVRDETNLIAFHYRVQDSPGYDNMEVNMDPILDYINDANHACLRREQDARRSGPLGKQPDPRVDVCVYFIAPHRLKPVDCKFISRLAKSVPVLPVLAKADSMTTGELEAFRKTVRDTLVKVGKDEGRPVVHEFSHEAMREAGVQAGAPPFAVISSNTNDLSVGKFWPVREYPWGACEALSSAHSDLPALKKLLFEVAYIDLKDATEQRYYVFREQQLMNLDDPTLPLHRGTIAEQLHRAGLARQSHRPLRRFFGATARYLAAGVAFYVVATYAAGGQSRIRSDVDRLQSTGGQAVETVQQQTQSAKDSIFGDKHREQEEMRKKRGPFGIFGRG